MPAAADVRSRDPAVGPDGRPLASARNLRLTLEYDGSRFAGWQNQQGVRTVQETLERALCIVLRHPTVVRGAGRTDSGVHAWAQVANVYTLASPEPRRLLRSINGLVGDGLRVITVEEVPLAFDARRDAIGKIYSYRLLHRPAGSALQDGRVWHIHGALDHDLLARELGSVCGTHDWRSYRATDCSSPTTVKTLYSAEFLDEGRGVLVLRYHGEGFLKQMVRILTGTAVEVARGRRPPGDMIRVRERRDRDAAGATAPPGALFLEEVLYGRDGS